MKRIKYEIAVERNRGTEQPPDIERILFPIEKECLDEFLDENLSIAKAEAYNGEVTVEEVPDPETPDTPTGDLETRVAAVEHDVADLTAAVEKGLSL